MKRLDIIKCPFFIFGAKDSNGDIWIYPSKDKILSQLNPSLKLIRASTEFMILSMNMTGGGTGMGPHDTFPNGMLVTAIRLEKNGTYNPKGERIKFYISGCFQSLIKESDITIVGKMRETIGYFRV